MILAALMMIIIGAILWSCVNNRQNGEEVSASKPVAVIEAVEEDIPVVLDYIGSIAPEETRRMAFKSSGRIRSIPVEKGDFIERGEVIAELDTEDLRYALMASEAQMEAAHAQYMKALNGASQEDINNAELNAKKARDASEFYKDTYEKMKVLYEASAISKQELDQAKLEMDIRQADLGQAEEILNQLIRGAREEDKEALFHQYQQAKADYLYRKNLLEDAVLIADIDGYIVDVFFKEGELYNGGYPLAIVRGEGQILKIGVTSKDLMEIEAGMRALVSVGNQLSEGIVSHINPMPNETTRTYAVEINILEGIFPIGETANVELMLGYQEAISIPISSILYQGEDFVFTVHEDKAERRRIEIIDVVGTNALVKGIKHGEMVVIEGMKNLRDGDQVTLKDRDVE